jgi:hypothetical protein
MDHNQNSYSAKEWAMFALFPVIKTAGVLPTQPLVKIAIEQQKSAAKQTGQLNFLQATKQIIAVRGLKGFFDGTVASMSREGFKTSYKGLLQVSANDLSKSLISDSSSAAYLLRGIIAGGFVGVLDPSIAAPIERYKTFKVSQDANGNLWNFLTAIKNQQRHETTVGKTSGVIRELYRGLGVTIAKQTAMNIAFFSTKAWADGAMKPYKNDYPVMSMAFASIIAGSGAALVGAPLDVAKTLKQQQTGKDIATIKLLKQVLAQSGFKGLFAGVPARFALITFGYGLNGLFLNIFDKLRTEKSLPASESTKNDEVEAMTKQFEQLSVSPQPYLPSQRLVEKEMPESLIEKDKAPSKTTRKTI